MLPTLCWARNPRPCIEKQENNRNPRPCIKKQEKNRKRKGTHNTLKDRQYLRNARGTLSLLRIFLCRETAREMVLYKCLQYMRWGGVRFCDWTRCADARYTGLRCAQISQKARIPLMTDLNGPRGDAAFSCWHA